MADSELKRHPRGQIALGAGELQQATLGDFTFTNNAKLKHTLRKTPSGVVLGTRECSGTIEVNLDEDGPERDWIGLVESGESKNFRFKMPLLTRTIEGVCSSVNAKLPLDDAVTLTISFVGKLLKE